jgi:MFS family permease
MSTATPPGYDAAVSIPRPPSSTSPWAVVASVWLTLGVIFGLFFSFPIFFVPLIDEFRWSRGAAAGAFSLSAVVQGLLSPAVGVLVDRLGPRRVMLGGATILGGSLLLGGSIGALWQLYLIIGVLGAAGVTAVGWVPSGALLSRWFAARRGSVMGIAFSGMGVGILVLGPLAQWLIAGVGWRRAYVLLGAGALVLLVPLIALGVREPPGGRAAAPAPARAGAPSPTREGVGLRDALATRTFWALFFAYLFTPLAVFPVVSHQVAFAVDHGFPALFVAGIFGLTGFMSVGGRIVFGVAADRIGRPLSATLSYACTGLGTLVLLSLETWRHPAALYVYALLFGAGFGARGPIITAMAAELFPGRRFGVIYGVMSVGNGLGGAIGPWFAGAIHDATGSYRIAFLLATSFCVLGSLCFWLARPPRGATLSTPGTP